MAPRSLRREYAELEREIIETILAERYSWPQSYSDMTHGVRALLRKFELRRRIVPLDRAEIEESA